MQKHVAEKARISLTKSRDRSKRLPLWLIVHSDGHAIHQTICDRERGNARRLCRDVLAATHHGFARVYWADNTAYLDAAWVGRVL